MEYGNLSEHDINCAVVAALQIESDVYIDERSITRHCIDGSVLHQTHQLNFCRKPEDAWPIIEQTGININKMGAAWEASFQHEDKALTHCTRRDPLRAAMEVFLMISRSK